MVERLRADAALPRAQRRLLGDFDKPRIETYVGVKKPGTGLRFADVLIIEEDFSKLEGDSLGVQVREDANEALRKYGETVDVRRKSLQSLLGQGHEVPVQRVRRVYDGKAELMPKVSGDLRKAMDATMAKLPGVEGLVQ